MSTDTDVVVVVGLVFLIVPVMWFARSGGFMIGRIVGERLRGGAGRIIADPFTPRRVRLAAASLVCGVCLLVAVGLR